MDPKVIAFMKRHQYTGPITMALLIGFVLYKFAGLSFQMSGIIAVIIGAVDIIGLGFLINRAQGYNINEADND